MTRTNDANKNAAKRLLTSVEVLRSTSEGDYLTTTRELMDGLMRAYLEAAAYARNAPEVKFYAQSVAVLRRLDRRLSALENLAKIGE